MNDPPDEGPDYRCPDDAVEDAHLIDLDDRSWLEVHLFFLDNLIVWFSLVQYYRPFSEREGVQIARVDCCHRTVHEHRYNQKGEDMLDHRPIQPIPTTGAQQAVHDAYDEAYSAIFDRWEQNLESWRRS